MICKHADHDRKSSILESPPQMKLNPTARALLVSPTLLPECHLIHKEQLAKPALVPMDQSYVICIFTVSKGFFCIIEGVSIICNIKIKKEK